MPSPLMSAAPKFMMPNFGTGPSNAMLPTASLCTVPPAPVAESDCEPSWISTDEPKMLSVTVVETTSPGWTVRLLATVLPCTSMNGTYTAVEPAQPNPAPPIVLPPDATN